MADALLGVTVVFVSGFRSVCTCCNISVSAVLGEKRPLENAHFPRHLILGRSPAGEFEFKINFQMSKMDLEGARLCV